MKHANRYWGTMTPPKSKAEFFNAVTSPSPTGEGTVATIRMYGPIDSWGGWWGISTKEVGDVLDALPDTVTQIILRINSPGGEVFEGVSILNMLRAHKASVIAVVDGLAASAASVIAVGCDEVVMSPGTQMMIHKPSVIAWGDADRLRHQAGVLDTIEQSIIDIYRAKAGNKNWEQLLADETWYTPAQAVAAGLADRAAVIPDAGETETVGAVPTTVDSDDDVEDSSGLRPVATSTFVATHKLPSSTEPGDPNRKEEAVAYSDLQAGLRERLGVTDADASDDTLLAAVDQALAEHADTPMIVNAIVSELPEGVQTIDKAVLDELRAAAAQGVAARAEQTEQRRAGIITDALNDGRILPASTELWKDLLEKDEEGTVKALNTLVKNTLPVTEIGHADSVTGADDALYTAAFGDEKED